jgi:hypothetical protein
MSERAYFLKAHKEFEERHKFVVRIFGAVGRLNVESRRAWANLLLFRLAMLGNSLLTLCMPELRMRMCWATRILTDLTYCSSAFAALKARYNNFILPQQTGLPSRTRN